MTTTDQAIFTRTVRAMVAANDRIPTQRQPEPEMLRADVQRTDSGAFLVELLVAVHAA